jgi:hypothetical protein
MYQVSISLNDDMAGFAALSDGHMEKIIKILNEEVGLYKPLFLFFTFGTKVSVPVCLRKKPYTYCVVDVSWPEPVLDDLQNKITALNPDCLVVCKDNSNNIIALDANNQTKILSEFQTLLYYKFLAGKKVNSYIEVRQDEL